MPRLFIMPDVNDRSVNEPAVIVSSAQILGLYNQVNKTDKKERIVDSVRDWYTARAETEGWAEVKFSGNQAVLKANINVEKVK